MRIHIEVTIDYSNYKINWNGPKPTSPRMTVFGWFAKEHPDSWGRCLAGYRGSNGWMEIANVGDLVEGAELPDQIFALVHCSGNYDGHQGGSSWYANHAFVDRKNAEAFIEKNDSAFEYYWIAPCRRQD